MKLNNALLIPKWEWFVLMFVTLGQICPHNITSPCVLFLLWPVMCLLWEKKKKANCNLSFFKAVLDQWLPLALSAHVSPEGVSLWIGDIFLVSDSIYTRCVTVVPGCICTFHNKVHSSLKHRSRALPDHPLHMTAACSYSESTCML